MGTIDPQLLHTLATLLDERFATQDKRIDAKLKELSTEFENHLGSLAEELDDKLATVLEGNDAVIRKQVEPLREDVQRIQDELELVRSAVKVNSKDIQSLDNAIGNVEHKVHHLHTMLVPSYLTTVAHLKKLDARVSRLEAAHQRT